MIHPVVRKTTDIERTRREKEKKKKMFCIAYWNLSFWFIIFLRLIEKNALNEWFQKSTEIRVQENCFPPWLKGVSVYFETRPVYEYVEILQELHFHFWRWRLRIMNYGETGSLYHWIYLKFKYLHSIIWRIDLEVAVRMGRIKCTYLRVSRVEIKKKLGGRGFLPF